MTTMTQNPPIKIAIKKRKLKIVKKKPVLTVKEILSRLGRDTNVRMNLGLDYQTLYLIMRSAAKAGFFKYRLAVLRK